MALVRQKMSILLNGGLDTKSHAEAQDPPNFRELRGFRFDESGRLAKVPTDGSAISVSHPTGSPWTSDEPHSLVSRNGEPVVVTEKNGLARLITTDGGTTYTRQHLMGMTEHFSVADPQLTAAPMPCEVTRQVIGSAQEGEVSEGIVAVAGCRTAAGHTLVAWVEPITGPTTMFGPATARLQLRVYSTVNGSEIGIEQHYVDLVGTSWYISASTYVDGADSGAIVSYCEADGSPPYLVWGLLWRDSARKFDTSTYTLATNTDSIYHSTYPYSTGILIGRNDNTSGNMIVNNWRISGVVSTHTATHPAFRPPAYVQMDSNVTILSLASSTSARSEVFGTPGSVNTIATASAGENFIEVRGARHLSGMLSYITVFDATVASTNAWMTEVVELSAGGILVNSQDVNNAFPIAQPVSYPDDSTRRAIVGFSKFVDAGLTSCILTRAGISANDGYSRIDPIARLVHDRLHGSVSVTAPLTSGAWIQDDTLYMVSMGDLSVDTMASTGGRLPQTIFLSKVKLSPDAVKPLQYVDVGRKTLLSSGVLHDYDGIRCTEAQPLNRPMLRYTGSAGSLSCKAVYRWVDSAGELHRSAPSEAMTSVASGQTIYVERPGLTALDGDTAPEIVCELYVTTGSGNDYYLANDTSGDKDQYDSVSSGDQYWVFSNVQAGSTANPPLYTNAGELESEPPPALHDISVVGDVIFGIDAEDRTRWWRTKPLVAGIAPEWHTTLTGVVADQLEAVVDQNGVPTLLGRSGVWQLYGEGPNAFGVGTYAPPKLVARVGCVSRASVCQTKYGTVFQTERGYVLLNNGLGVDEIGLPIEPLTNVRVHSPNRVIYDPHEDELRIAAGTHQYFFSFREGKWSRNQETSSLRDILSLPHGSSGQTILKSRANGSVYFESVGSSNTDSSYWETPWIKMDAIEGFGRLWKMALAVRTPAEDISSNVTVTLDFYADFDDSVLCQWTFGSSKIANWEQDAVEVLEPLRPTRQRVRSFKIGCSVSGSTAHSGIIPLSLMLEYGIDPSHRPRGSRRTPGAPL